MRNILIFFAVILGAMAGSFIFTITQTYQLPVVMTYSNDVSSDGSTLARSKVYKDNSFDQTWDDYSSWTRGELSPGETAFFWSTPLREGESDDEAVLRIAFTVHRLTKTRQVGLNPTNFVIKKNVVYYAIPL